MSERSKDISQRARELGITTIETTDPEALKRMAGGPVDARTKAIQERHRSLKRRLGKLLKPTSGALLSRGGHIRAVK